MLALLAAVFMLSPNSRVSASDRRESSSASPYCRRRSRMSARLMSARLSATLADRALRAMASASSIAASSRTGSFSSSSAADSAIRALAMPSALAAASANRNACWLASSAFCPCFSARYSVESW